MLTVFRQEIKTDTSGQKQVWAHEVGSWSGKLLPEEFADLIRAVGLFYHRAYVCVERNNSGISTVDRLDKCYPANRLYHERTAPADGHRDIAPRIGFVTTSITKNHVMNQFGFGLKEGRIILRTPKTIAELKSLTKTKGKCKTQGFDNAMSAIFAYEACCTDMLRLTIKPEESIELQTIRAIEDRRREALEMKNFYDALDIVKAHM